MTVDELPSLARIRRERAQAVVYRKAVGGFLWHVTPLFGLTARCGFRPRREVPDSQRVQHGGDRGYWASTSSHPGPEATCPKCARKA